MPPFVTAQPPRPVELPTDRRDVASSIAESTLPRGERVNSSLKLCHPVMNYARSELKSAWLVLQSNAARYTDALASAFSHDRAGSEKKFESHLADHRAVYDLSQDLLRRLDQLSPFMTPVQLSLKDEEGHVHDLQHNKSGDPEYQLNDSLRRLETILLRGMEANSGQPASVRASHERAVSDLHLLYAEMKSLARCEAAATEQIKATLSPSTREVGHTSVEPLFFHNERLYQRISDNMHTVHFKPDSPEVALEGLTLTPHPPERIRAMVEDGARIITYSTESNGLVAHSIFFNPEDARTQAKEFMHKLPFYSPAAFIHSIHVNSDQSVGQDAYRKMLMATITALQYSESKYLAGVVHQDNWRGIATHLGLGSANLVASAELRRGDERFFACVLPVDPALRREPNTVPLPAREFAREVQQKRLPGLFPQNWQESAASWVKNHRIHTWISQKLTEPLTPHDRAVHLRHQREVKYEMQGFETRVSMLEGGRNLLHLLRTGQPVPDGLWKQLATGRLANHGRELTKEQLVRMLDEARDPTLVRITGGCGLLEQSQWKGMLKLFREGFSGFGGAMLVGGTRMLVEADGRPTTAIRPGITEVPMEIRRECPDAVIGGLVLGTERYDTTKHTVLFDQHAWSLGDRNMADSRFITILNPEIDYFTYVDHSHMPADRRWDAEFEDAIDIANTMCCTDRPGLRRFSPLLMVYNGGGTTEREVKAWCDLRWPVMLIKGSGRMADELASNSDFLHANPNVQVCSKDGEEINLRMKALKIIPA